MTVEDALAEYLLQLEADGRSRHTIMQARRHISLLQEWLRQDGRSVELDAIDRSVLARFLVSDCARLMKDGSPKRATSLNSLRSSLRTFFGWLAAAGLIETDPARLIRRARCAPVEARGPGPEDCEKLLAAVDAGTSDEDRRDRALVRLLLGSGLRLGEALALDVEDADLEQGEVLVRRSKGDRPRVAVLGHGVVEALQEATAGRATGPVFRTQGGERLGARQARRRLARCCERAGIAHIRPHGLRHAFATRLYARTCDLGLVQAALGHRSIVSTMVYAKRSSHDVRRALESPPAAAV